jgi:hypothetical protein
MIGEDTAQGELEPIGKLPIYLACFLSLLLPRPMIVLGTLTIVTLMWTLSYARRIRLRVSAQVSQLLLSNAP